MFVRKCIDGKLRENFAEYFSLLNHEKRSRNNSISLNLPSVRNEFFKRPAYFSDAKLYELSAKIRQLDRPQNFPNAISTYFNWNKRHCLNHSIVILCNIDLKVLRRNEMLLNFSMKFFYKSFFRLFESFFRFSPYFCWAHIVGFCHISVITNF